MANIYYKINQSEYKQLNYADINAAAEKHTHLMSDIGMLNFQNNGCLGQNATKNLNTNYPNILFYVPQPNSDIVYAKRMPESVIANPTVPWCNINEIVSYNISTTAATNINSHVTTFYEYKNTYPIIINNKTLYTIPENYYCYYYPLQIKCLENNDNNITLSFKTNLKYALDTIETEQFDDYKIVFKPIIKNSKVYNYEIVETTIPDDNINIYTLLGLISNQNTVMGMCIILNEKIQSQIELSNLQITTNAELSVKQYYNDYYNISSMPPMEISGSLGTVTQSGYNYTLESMKRYYRSHKFYNLLTYGQKVIINQCIISGYSVPTYTTSGSTTTTSFKHGYFILYWPYEIDPVVLNIHSGDSYNDILRLDAIWSKITEDNEEAYSKYTEIWALGKVIVNSNNGMPLIANSNKVNTANQINYNILQVKPGMLGIEF